MSSCRASSRSWLAGICIAGSVLLLLAGTQIARGVGGSAAAQSYPSGVFLNEFMPNPEADWNNDGILGDANDEYIELYNANDVAVDLSGWMLDDVAGGGTAPYVLPAGTVIQARGFLVFWSRDTGIGLNNSGGDAVRLLTPDGVEVESHGYTAAPADVSYSKTVDGGGEWTMAYPPSPGGSNQPAPTATPTPTATPAVYPTGIRLNEFMPNPEADWNDDGILGDANDEYIELYNANDFAVDLGGWMLDDIAASGTAPYVLPSGTMIQARGFLVFWSRDTGIGLNNSGGDAVRLLTPDGVEVESHSYTSAPADVSYSKTVDGGAEWTMAYPPSPGASNQPAPTPTATATSSPTATATPTATSSPTPTATTGTRPTFTATPSPTITATPALPPTPYPTGISLNEFMPNPEADWNDDGILGDANDEYIELYNANDFAVDLSGWQVDDVASGGSSPFTLAAGTLIEAQGFLVLWRRDTGIALNNSGGDAVRLMTPDGVEVERHSYTAAPADVSYSKTADGGDEWTMIYPPSPGASNQPALTPTPTPTATPGVYPDGVSLNEYMPDPASDWNGNGVADLNDEYIELYNANDFALDLSGWQVDDIAGGGSAPYTLPTGSTIPARGFLLLFRSQSGIALNNDGDWVRLLRPDGAVVEETQYTSSRDDEAYSKTADGGSVWTRSYPPSPGAPNRPANTPTPTRTPTPAVYPSGISLNEFMPNPEADWNGDGILGDANDEYIELYNANDFAVDLSGWRVDDIANGGSSPYTLPAGTVIEAQGFLVLWSRDTGLALNNSGGDAVRLLRPDGVEMERHEYTAAPADVSYSKTTDGGDEWTMSYPPSPNASNAPAGTPTPTATPGVYPDSVSLNEFMPNPESDWNGDGILGDANDEYIELYNANDFAVDLSGWQVDDVAGGGSAPYTLPAGAVIEAQGYLALWSRDTNIALNNSGGDSVRLLRPDGVEVESHSYTAAPADVSYSKTVEGGDEWTMIYPPSPGAANLPGATPTPTATAPPVTYPDGVSLNEFMPNPEADWNGDGILGDANDEYIELYNANEFAVDLSGWQVDDIANGGSAPYTLPAGTVVEAHSFLALWSRDTNIALNNSGGDAVRLLRPDGVEVERHEYTVAPADVSYSKTVDGGDEWTMIYPPSPGAANQPATPTPTPTATPTTTPGVYPDGVSLNEYMPDPASDWNGDGVADQNDEYIELYNANEFAADLSGWQLDDVASGGSAPYTLPAGTTIPARGFLLFFRSQSGIALNNDGDWVRLLRPDGVVVEETQYSTSRDDQAYSKLIDGGTEWTRSHPPSPGGSNHPGGTPTPTPTATPPLTPTPVLTTVRLNELLPSPRDVDWDGNGVPSYLDEWIELANLGDEPVNLAGWKLVDGLPAGREPTGTYVLPAGAVIPPRGYLVIFRGQSGLALDASNEQVRLLYPDNSLADSMSYSIFSGYDQSWCRLPDGVGAWSRFCIESPGQPNQGDPNSGGTGGGSSPPSGPPYDRFNFDLATIAHARSLPDGVRLTLEGQVTTLPGVFDDNEIYIQDATGGIRVFLRSAEWPPLSEGQWVRVNGRLGTFYEERQISLVRIDDIKTMQPAAPLAPLPIRSGEVNEANEGRLVQISGPITGFWRDTTLYLDDGSGEARITLRPMTGIRRPYVVIGETWTVVGVVSQTESGYRLLPRREADLQRGRAAASRSNGTTRANGVQNDMAWNTAPVYLPVTGATLTVRPPAPADLREAWLMIR